MKKELRIFFTALMFMTRLPVPRTTDHSHEYLERSAKYFPLIGWIVGAISGITFVIVNKYIGEDLAILASIIAGIFTTGALHEDGFADVCDAFGGGWTKEKILLIMKDSRLGTFGVIGLISILAAKFLLLKELPKFSPSLGESSLTLLAGYMKFLWLLIAAHAVSRWMSVLIIRFYDYVSDPEGSKSKPVTQSKPSLLVLLMAGIFALVPFIFIHPYYLFVLIPVLIAAFSFANYCKTWIGGYTGDCLGAIQQVSELVFYLSALIIGRYFL